MKHILLDMDMVIADLTTAMNQYLNTTNCELDRDRFFANLKHFAREGRFATLPNMKDADKLVSYLVDFCKSNSVNLSICTSVGHFYEPISEVVVQKKRWIESNFPSLARVPFITVCSGGDKAKFANPNTMLIDDHHTNIKKFRDNGGIGVQYDAYNGGLDTVKEQLKLFLE